MASYKIVIALVAFFVASCTGATVEVRFNNIRNIDQCDVTKAIIPLLQTNIYESAHLLGSVTRTINFPESGLNTHTISCIKVINMDTSTHGGHPDIVSGGIGSNDVQIQLTSQWGQPLNFRIEIWAEA